MFDRILQKHFLNTVPENSVLFVAFSGGVDSHVLLHSLVPFKDKFQLKAIHIHHGLMPNADDWSEHCQKICDDLYIDCEVVRVNVKPKKGESIEACARKARYDAFEKIMRTVHSSSRGLTAGSSINLTLDPAVSTHLGCKPRDDGSLFYLLTGHHLDDQAETCLLQFLRGSGFRGLASMPEITAFANGFLARPFLQISRKEIVEYAKKNKLKWIEDESNHDTKFARNFIRYELMPVLQKRYPSVTKSMMRVAEHAAEAEVLLQALAEIDYRGQAPAGACPLIDISNLKKLSLPRQKNVIRYWLLKQNFLMPSTVKLNHILTDVINAREDAEPCVHWEGVEIHRFQNHLYAMKPLPPHDATKIYPWDGKSDIKIPNIVTIRAIDLINQLQKNPNRRSDGAIAISDKKNKITIRFRQGGEIIKLNGKTKSLKNYFQEKKIPPWERDRIPLLYVDHELHSTFKRGATYPCG